MGTTRQSLKEAPALLPAEPSGSIEETIETLNQRNHARTDGILGPGSGATLAMTEGDLDMLLAQ